MTPDSAQNHIKWAALEAFDILSKYKVTLPRLREAFKRGDSLEECIAIIESSSNTI